jgi:hypothetical protein
VLGGASGHAVAAPTQSSPPVVGIVIAFMGGVTRLTLLAFSLSLALVAAVRAGDTSSEFIAEMNLARTQPQVYARIVAQRGPAMGCSPRDVAEAVRFLEKQRPLHAFVHSPGLSQAALAHVLDTGPRGIRSHRGSDGSSVSRRAARFGRWDLRVGENIYFGRGSARDAVVALIVDQGVRSRGHRRNIFDKGYRYAGAATGGHAMYGGMAVTDFAAVYQEGGRNVAAR